MQDVYSAVVDKVYVTVADVRSAPDSDGYASHPFCYGNALCAGEDPCNGVRICPLDINMWSYTDFTVAFGSGGAVATSGENNIELNNVTMTGNVGGAGSAMNIIGATRVVVKSSIFDGNVGTQDILSTVALQQCSGFPNGSLPCDLGQQCTYSDLSIHCEEPCGLNEYGDGENCIPCTEGKEPNSEQPVVPTGCAPCEPGESSPFGLCKPCEAGQVPNAERTACVPCEAGTFSNTTDCVSCSGGEETNSEETGCLSCAAIGVNAATAGGSQTCEPCGPGQQPSEDRTNCISCPTGQFNPGGNKDVACESCDVGKEPDTDQSQCADCVDTVSETGIACSPCQPGSQPNEGRVFCEPCAAGKVSAIGSICDECPGAGEVANVNATECVSCPPGSQPNSEHSDCVSCRLQGPEYYSELGISCTQCDPLQTPNAGRTACFCQLGTYNVGLYGQRSCPGAAVEEAVDGLECMVCPDCLECIDDGHVLLDEGFAFYGKMDNTWLALECPVPEGCIGGTLKNDSLMNQDWYPADYDSNSNEFHSETALSSQCNEGYTGPICTYSSALISCSGVAAVP